jgi:hypothetical protein
MAVFGVTGQSAVSPRAADVGDGGPRMWPSLLLVAMFVVGLVLVPSVVLVRGRSIDAGMYSDPLVRTDAYERVYTEVLADPEFAELTEQLLGGLDRGALGPTEAQVLATSVLRSSVPVFHPSRGHRDVHRGGDRVRAG